MCVAVFSCSENKSAYLCDKSKKRTSAIIRNSAKVRRSGARWREAPGEKGETGGATLVALVAEPGVTARATVRLGVKGEEGKEREEAVVVGTAGAKGEKEAEAREAIEGAGEEGGSCCFSGVLERDMGSASVRSGEGGATSVTVGAKGEGGATGCTAGEKGENKSTVATAATAAATGAGDKGSVSGTTGSLLGVGGASKKSISREAEGEEEEEEGAGAGVVAGTFVAMSVAAEGMTSVMSMSAPLSLSLLLLSPLLQLLLSLLLFALVSRRPQSNCFCGVAGGEQESEDVSVGATKPSRSFIKEDKDGICPVMFMVTSDLSLKEMGPHKLGRPTRESSVGSSSSPPRLCLPEEDETDGMSNGPHKLGLPTSEDKEGMSDGPHKLGRPKREFKVGI